jgi:1,4-alpha-glucan branching enzyme
VRLTRTADVWWKNAVVYCLDVETYADGNGDGCGDFRGLIQKIDHLHRLGVTCIWLMPFYPTPDRDDGYDIVDFYGVDPRLGTLGDAAEFLRTARDRGMRDHRRSRGPPHIRAAPVVPERPQQPGLAIP